MNKKGQIESYVMLGVVLITGILMFNWYFGWTCFIQDWLSKDKYCSSEPIEPISNFSNSLVIHSIRSHDIRSHEADRLAQIQQDENNRKAQEESRRAKACYDQGYDINRSLDIIQDYNFTCPKLAYINDHFVDKVDQKDGGYIDGSSFGIGIGTFGIGFSHGSVDGKFYEYVVTHVSATGQLVQSEKYHIDCNGAKSNEETDYYSESEFVMYYVNRCVK